MDCLTVRENINAYIDRELSEVESRAVQSHIDICKSCKHEYDAYSLTRAFIADHSPAPSPPGLSESIRIMMEKERLIPKRRFFPRIKRTNTLLAASIALAVVTGAVLMNTIDVRLPSMRGGAAAPQTDVIAKVVPAPAEKPAPAEADSRRAATVKVIVTPGSEQAAADDIARRDADVRQKRSPAAVISKAEGGVHERDIRRETLSLSASRPAQEPRRAAARVVEERAAGKAEAASVKEAGGSAQARKSAAGVSSPGSLSGYMSASAEMAKASAVAPGKDIPVIADDEKKADSAVAAAPAAPEPAAARTSKAPRPGRINVPLPTISQYPMTGFQQGLITPEQMLAMTSNTSPMTEDYLFMADRTPTMDGAPRGEAVSASTGSSMPYDKGLMSGYYTSPGSAGAVAAAAPESSATAASKGSGAKDTDKSAKKAKTNTGASKKSKATKKEDKPVDAATTTKAAGEAKKAKPPLNMTVKVRAKDPEQARAIAIKNIKAKGGTVVEKDGKIIMSMPASDTLANLKNVRAGAAAGSQITVPEKLLNNESRDAEPRTVNTEIIFVTDDKAQ